MEESWKYVKGYENLYQITPSGKVRNNRRELKGFLKHGYKLFRLTKQGHTKEERVHRLLWLTFVGPIDSGLCIDHIDRNRLNNKIVNLRIASIQQNCVNRTFMPKNKTGFRGVVRRRNLFVAQITFNYKVTYLGTFLTPKEASDAYQRRARELHGSFYSSHEE